MTPARRRSPAQQPGRAQRRGGFGGLSRLRKLHDARKPKEASAATRTSAAERGFGGLPRLRKLHDAHAPKEPSAAERGVRGIPRLRQHSTLTCQEEPSAATRHHAPEDRPPPSAHYLVSLGESKGVYTHVCFSGEAKRRKLCLDFPRTRALAAPEKNL